METVNQEVTTNEPERTFTQAEVDAIVGDRLKRDRAKYADYDDLKAKADKFDEITEANKSELQKAVELNQTLQAELESIKTEKALQEMRSKVSEETGVPANLLNGTSEEECQAQAKSILEFKKPKTYPNVRDAGEVQKVGKPTTRQQFAEWVDQAFN